MLSIDRKEQIAAVVFNDSDSQTIRRHHINLWRGKGYLVLNHGDFLSVWK